MSDILWSTQRLKVSDLKPYERNPRLITKDKYQKLIESIQRLGYMTPIIAQPDGRIIGGHARKKALQELKIKEVDVRIPNRELTEEEYKEALLRDNISNGDWDFDILSADFDYEFLDFVGLEVPGIAKLPTEVDEDEAPEVQETAKSVRGDVWLLGKHRVMCGDSTMIDDVEKLMNGQKADLFLTDPPYNVNYEGKTKKSLKIQNDKMGNDNFREFLKDAFLSAVSVMKQGAAYYIWHADSEGYNFRGAANDAGLTVRQCLIWKKNIMVMGRQDYHWQHEPCLYGWKDGASHLWASDRKQTTVLEFDRPSKNLEHPTMKPVALFAYQIGNNTKPGDLAFDLFGGSGTTLIASEQTGRTCYMMELDPIYCDVIIRRWQNLTGQQAVHESTGHPFGD